VTRNACADWRLLTHNLTVSDHSGHQQTGVPRQGYGTKYVTIRDAHFNSVSVHLPKSRKVREPDSSSSVRP